MKTLYFECNSGISGDMTVGALLDLGVSEALLREQLASLPIDGYEIKIHSVLKHGISAKKFDVLTEHHDHHDHHHHHVGLREIQSFLEQSKLSDTAKEIANRIFCAIADAESKIHGTTPQEVHFHEVGAVDSIVDVVATAVCMDQLKVDRVVFSKIREGQGTVRCAHGDLPVPVPATLALLSSCNAELVFTETQGEMVTPTGAAIAAVLGSDYGVPCPAGKLLKIGYGAGTKEFAHPNLLRVMLVEETSASAQDTIIELKTQVDDMTGEELGFAMEQLFAAGCVDVFYTPIQMKKNRPGVLLTALCRESDRQTVLDTIFFHTTTLGVRINLCERVILPREICDGYKETRVSGTIRRHAEYERAAELARVSGCSLREAQSQLISGRKE